MQKALESSELLQHCAVLVDSDERVSRYLLETLYEPDFLYSGTPGLEHWCIPVISAANRGEITVTLSVGCCRCLRGVHISLGFMGRLTGEIRCEDSFFTVNLSSLRNYSHDSWR